mmetsp:Transcript_12518/g.18132  ORF Transcript_12518/g.18132 Transcript_12518/m.18132 type:complete len:86 (-) Transcript_12518:106-363(-)
MYLQGVISDIRKESAPPNILHAEHLYKLNEAVFNLPEEDQLDTRTVTKLFQTVEKIRNAFSRRHVLGHPFLLTLPLAFPRFREAV